MDEADERRFIYSLARSIDRQYKLGDGYVLKVVRVSTVLRIRLESKPREDNFPRFRILVWCGRLGLTFSIRQEGFDARASVKKRLNYSAADLKGRAIRLVEHLISDERKRQIDYRART